MSLNVETGTGSSTSESFASVADADLYHSNRGNSAWAAIASTALKEAALRKATDYMEQTYRLRWLGYRVSITQALSWPRDEVQRQDFTFLNQYSYYPNNEVPTEVKNACAELALKASSGALLADLTQGVKRKKVDVLEIEYDQYSPQTKRYVAIDRLLAPFLSGSSASHSVVRS
jgi:hypothetical protein